MNRRPASTPRSAFTLIELLVVISIIGLLMALLLPAVHKIRVAGKRTQTGAEIGQLNTAATSFHMEFKFYPPDRFDGTTPAGIAILQQMYPRWTPGPGYVAPNVAGQPLVGIQCLIYFACGPQLTGWAIDAPVAPTGTNKKGPFFDYSGPPLNTPALRYTLNDPFGSPYAYFASSTGGSYPSGAQTPGYLVTYPNGATFGPISPFTTGSPARPVNSGTVQIISAGANKTFGPGGTGWTPGSGLYSSAGIGGDDMANFNGGAQLSVIP